MNLRALHDLKVGGHESGAAAVRASWSKTPVDVAPGGSSSLSFTLKIGEKWKINPSVSSTLICIKHTLELQVRVEGLLF